MNAIEVAKRSDLIVNPTAQVGLYLLGLHYFTYRASFSHSFALITDPTPVAGNQSGLPIFHSRSDGIMAWIPKGQQRMMQL